MQCSALDYEIWRSIIIITISSQGLGFMLRTANKAIHMISMMYWEVKHLFKHQHYLENSCQIIPCFISTLSRCSECSGWVEPRQSAVCEGKQQWRLFWNSSQVLSFCSLKMSEIYDLIRYQIVPPIFLLGFPIVTQVSKTVNNNVVHLFTFRTK